MNLVSKHAAALAQRLDGEDEIAERLEAANTHRLRHTYGTRAVAGNVPPSTLKEQMGHADNLRTNRLARVRPTTSCRIAGRSFRAAWGAGGRPSGVDCQLVYM